MSVVGPQTRSSSSVQATGSAASSAGLSEAIKTQMEKYFSSEQFISMMSTTMKNVLSETIQTTLDDHATKMKALDEKMAAIQLQNSKLSDSLNDESRRSSSLQTKVVALEFQNSKLYESLSEVRNQVDRVLFKCNDNEQYSRRSNVRVFGIDESPDESCEGKILDFVKAKLDIDLREFDIDRCHRVGLKKAGKPRAIIVKLDSYKVKSRIIKSRKKLKGTAFLITEDLTKENYSLLRKVREAEETSSAWSVDGKIFAKFSNGGPIKIIRRISDIKKD